MIRGTWAGVGEGAHPRHRGGRGKGDGPADEQDGGAPGRAPPPPGLPAAPAAVGPHRVGEEKLGQGGLAGLDEGDLSLAPVFDDAPGHAASVGFGAKRPPHRRAFLLLQDAVDALPAGGDAEGDGLVAEHKHEEDGFGLAVFVIDADGGGAGPGQNSLDFGDGALGGDVGGEV